MSGSTIETVVRSLVRLGDGWHANGSICPGNSYQSVGNSLRHAFAYRYVERIRSKDGRRYLWRVTDKGRRWDAS